VKLNSSLKKKCTKLRCKNKKKKLVEATKNFNVELTKHEISDIERARVQENVEELR
jgi:hypothetical protein